MEAFGTWEIWIELDRNAVRISTTIVAQLDQVRDTRTQREQRSNQDYVFHDVHGE